MEKIYTYGDFCMNEYAYKPIVDEGHFYEKTGRYEINYSSILTRLIQEAGRFCESFASDLFIDWQNVVNTINEQDGEFESVFLFGFRQHGVDHDNFIFSRYKSEGIYARANYRSMWRLDVSADGKDITMKLGRVF